MAAEISVRERREIDGVDVEALEATTEAVRGEPALAAARSEDSSMGRIASFAYGSLCYALFLATFVYSIGFFSNLWVPKTVDSGPAGPVGASVAVNLLLLSLFALQHSGMARPAFKRWWTRIVPAPVERSTYVLLTCAALALLYGLWQPLPAVVWQAPSPWGHALLLGGHFLGWGLVLYSTVLIDHFDLFGLRQVVRRLQRREYEPPRFATPALYKVIRHPLYVGWFTVLWCAPTMTAGHLLLAAVASAYILVAVRFEERDLVAAFGERYARYRESTPAFLPRPRRRAAGRALPVA